MATDGAVPDFIHDSARSLPTLPAAAKRLLALAQDLDVDFREITRVIESDQILTARVLRAANSPIYSASRRVQTLRQATVMLGRDTIINLALSASVMSLQNQIARELAVDLSGLAKHNIAVALAARELAKQYRLPNPGEAFVAGLLHDIGKLVLLTHFGDTYAKFLLAAGQNPKPLVVLEDYCFDIDHAVAGQVLCQLWNLPETLVEAVAEHHEKPAPKSLAWVVSQANDLAKLMHLGEGGNPYITLQASSWFGEQAICPAWLSNLIATLPEKVHEAEAIFGAQTELRTHARSEHPLSVYLQTVAPAEREVLTMVLLAMGYSSLPDINGTPPVAILVHTEDFDTSAYTRADIPVLNYTAAWRRSGKVLLDGYLNIFALRTWLKEHLEAIIHQA